MTHRNTVKRCEETRQLMNSDFPRQHRYTGVCRVCLQAGQHLSGVGWGHCQANPSRPSILHLYDSRFSSGPSAARSLFWHSMGAHQSHAAVGCRLAKEQATQSMSNTPPVSFHNGHPAFIRKVAPQAASFKSFNKLRGVYSGGPIKRRWARCIGPYGGSAATDGIPQLNF